MTSDPGLEKIEQIEKQLFAQEHRSWVIWKNRFLDFSQQSASAQAGIKAAYVWWWVRLFSPIHNTGVKLSFLASVIALVTVAYYIREVGFLEKQVALAEKQLEIEQDQLAIATAESYKPELEEILQLLRDPTGDARINEDVRARIIDFSRRLKPYLTRNRERKADRRALSPERGQLLKMLVREGFTEILEKVNLTCAEVDGVDFTGAELDRTELGSASIRRATLTRCNLQFAYLVKADFTGSFLNNADLRNADMRDGIFIQADLRGANLCDADLRNADFGQARLDGAIVNESWDDAIGPGWITVSEDGSEVLRRKD